MTDTAPPSAPPPEPTHAPGPSHDDDVGLTRLALPELRQLLRAIEQGHVAVPLTSTALAAAGLAGVVPSLPTLAGLDRPALRTLLRAMIAERTRRPVPTIDLVWTGPEARVSRSRDTAVVVAELFASARKSVLVAGFAFDHPEEILRPLHAVMRDHGVETSLFVNLSAHALPGLVDARAAADRFLQQSWPFGPPYPRLFYDPRTADPATRTSLHAKVVVVDERRTLVTSANFTSRGQTRNLELGALIEEPDFAREVVGQWRALVDAGALCCHD